MKIKIQQGITVPKVRAVTVIEQMSVFVFFLFTLWARIWDHSQISLTVASILLSVAGVIGISKMILDQNKRCLLYFLFLICSWLSVFLLRFGDIFYDFVDMANTLFFWGIAYILLTTKTNYKLYRLLFYIVALYFFVEIIILKRPIRGLLADGNSYNYISCFMIFYFALYAFSLLKDGKFPGYIDSFILVTVIIFSYGRGGIVSAVIYLVGYIFITLNKNRTRIFLYLFLMSALLFVFVCWDQIMELLLSDKNFGKFVIYGFNSNGRSNIWGTFLCNSTSNVINFVAGADPREILEDGNLHNSFLQMWAAMGFIFFTVNIILLIICIVKKTKEKNWYYLLILGTFLVRAFFDKMMYRWYGEILFYFCFIDMFVMNYKEHDITVQKHNVTK